MTGAALCGLGVVAIFAAVILYALSCRGRTRAGWKCAFGTFFFESEERSRIKRPARSRRLR